MRSKKSYYRLNDPVVIKIPSIDFDLYYALRGDNVNRVEPDDIIAGEIIIAHKYEGWVIDGEYDDIIGLDTIQRLIKVTKVNEDWGYIHGIIISRKQNCWNWDGAGLKNLILSTQNKLKDIEDEFEII